MARRFSRGGARSFRPQTSPRTNWMRIVDAASLTVPPLTRTFMFSLSLDNVGIGETVRRTRGRFLIASDQSGGIESQNGAFGLIVVTTDAASVGATAIPGPVSSAPDDGWFVWEPFHTRVTDGLGTRFYETFSFDSKAMRRIEEGYLIAVMVENADATTGLEINVSFSLLTSRN